MTAHRPTRCRPQSLVTCAVLAVVLAALLAGCGGGPLPGLFGSTDEDVPQAQDTYPFTTNGYVVNWGGNTTINVYIPTCAIAGCSSPAFETEVRNGIAEWAAQHSRFNITVNDTSVTLGTDDVRVEWDDGTGVPLGVLGYAYFDTTSGTVTRGLKLATRVNVDGYRPMTITEIHDVVTHEWGHMLGIWSHSFDPADLMYPYYSGQPGLTARDRAVMGKVYSFAPDLNLASLPPNAFMLPSGLLQVQVRFLYGFEAVPHTPIEFRGDPTYQPRHAGLP